MRNGESPLDPDAIGAGHVLELIRERPATTRAELVRQTGLSRSTLAKRVQSLLALDLVREVDGHASTGGRPPATVVFNRNAGVVLAADVGLTSTRVAVCDLAGEPLAERVVGIGVDQQPEPLLGAVHAQFGTLLETAGVDASQVWGIGVGLPAPAALGRGEPLAPPLMPGWDGFSVGGWLTAHRDAPVLVDSQVNTMALGEHRTHWRDVDHLIFVEIGATIGCGIVAGRHIHRGAQGTAGDIGHIRLPGHDDVVCRCGNTGCVEALANSGALVARLTAAGLPVETGADVVALVRAGEPLAVQAVRAAGRHLGAALAQCINFFNPGAIVIGGEMAEAHQQLLVGVREVALARSLPMATRDLRMARSELGDRAGVIGAAIMVSDHLLAPETIDRAVGGHAR